MRVECEIGAAWVVAQTLHRWMSPLYEFYLHCVLGCFVGGVMKFATQILPLLNCLRIFAAQLFFPHGSKIWLVKSYFTTKMCC